jgi:CDP-diglyceride synthetase
MSAVSLRLTAFVLSLIGGIVIVAGSAIAAFLSTFGSPYGTYYGMGPGMMGGFGYMYGYGLGWMLGLSLIALVSGIVVLVGAVMLNSRPEEHVTWGIIVLVFSLVSFVGMGGYFIGAILGTAGGAIALSYRAQSKTQEHETKTP